MDNGLSTCEDKIYSDKYVDYIIDYNKNTQYELRLYEMDCIQEVNDRLVVAYSPRYASDFIMGKVAYRALPKCY